MASPRKAAGYLQSLEQALKNERYNEIPELSRKVRKHDPSRTCFARSTEVQALLSKRIRANQERIDNDNFNDTRGGFHWLSLRVEQLSAEKSLLDEAYTAHKTATAEDKAYYDLTNFFYGLVIGQLEAATTLEAQISSHPHNPFLSQSVALRGVLEELRGHREAALREYQAFPYPDLSSSSFESSLWLEHIKYRLAILSPSEGTTRAFQNFNAQHKRGSNSRMLHVLSMQGDNDTYTEELLARTGFPAADSTNIRLLDVISKSMDDWIANGSDPLKAEGHLNRLYEAGSRTFHSPRLLRYLVFVLTALDRHDEALLALDAYLQVAVHAQKTQPGADVDSVHDIVDTIHFAISNLLKHVSIVHEPAAKARNLGTRLSKIVLELDPNQSCAAIVQQINGLTMLLEYYASHDPSALENAIKTLSRENPSHSKSAECQVALSIAQAQAHDMAAAMSTIRLVLDSQPSNVAALLVFANLLSTEELFDRALKVLDIVDTIALKPVWTFKDGNERLTASLMRLKVIEAVSGPEEALRESQQLLLAYRRYVDPSINSAPALTNGHHARYNGAAVSTSNGPTPHQAPSHAPSITIDAPQETSTPAFLTPDANSTASVNTPSLNGSAPRMAPIAIHEKLRSSSGPSRASSLKVTPSPRHLSQHLHLRKSASVRSMRGQDSIENSSRSSSPLNHPAPSITSILPDTSSTTDEVELDRQLTAAELQDSKRKELLAEIWLYIAHLCRSSGSRPSEVDQAIHEAIALVGSTPAIIITQLEVRLELARAQGLVTDEDLHVIEEGYDFALNMDDTCATTILSFARFLLTANPNSSDDEAIQLRDGRVARAYELLESLKSSPHASDPTLWHLSAECALARGEEDRAEEDSWRAIEKSDVAGVIDWFRLWRLT